jgi:hypothetical protein
LEKVDFGGGKANEKFSTWVFQRFYSFSGGLKMGFVLDSEKKKKLRNVVFGVEKANII